ncbi:esterase/lipase family protein [Candidatus Laterigemmans baculatus]|uniref:esterase/lipase family protein n=1 Tax=Candidatus Laterigemmans baculatus TaxID=2770505 RepID=UPI001F3185CB|nr:alpha/beta fold hydrolase [Candidatus Laterigemmans baculatus]
MKIPARMPTKHRVSPGDRRCDCAIADRPAEVRRGLLAACSLTLVLAISGCASTQYLTLRSTRENALAGTLKLVSRQGPQIRDRTAHLLRRYGLSDQYAKDPVGTIEALRTRTDAADADERKFAVAELAYIEGKRAERERQIGQALDHYAVTLISSYDYLFSEDYSATRNPYDPQFRGACDLYNEALEDTLRLLCAEHQLRPGQNYTIQTGKREFTIETKMRGSWSAEDFDHFEFVSDYQIQTLNNRHKTYGLGVPLIAVRKPPVDSSGVEAYYPEGVSFAVTAMIRGVRDRRSRQPQAAIASAHDDSDAGYGAFRGGAGELQAVEEGREHTPRCVLEFFDPLRQNQIYLANQWVPLQTDLTTPLAYFLDTPQFRKRNTPTAGLLDPNQQQETKGLFMLEPYDPERIPVVMVHGLWSSPLTWMDMFNDLRSFPEIRERYQFWFYLYPTGQPFWISATQMRADLVKARQVFDPRAEHATVDQMVLVGHSMGGLVSRMQSIDSGDEFWRIVSDQPIDQLRGEPEDVQKLVSTLKFRPNNSVARVITIATPHRGSDFANEYTRWLGRRLIKLPNFAVSTGNRLAKENPDFFKDSELLTMNTAIDSLAPDSPIFPVMLRAKRSPRVVYHNIVGVVDSESWLGSVAPASDGVVAYPSAHMDDVESELIVNADHTTIHTEPESILEVRRILLEHIAEIDAQDRVAREGVRSQAVQPAAAIRREEATAKPPRYRFGLEPAQ